MTRKRQDRVTAGERSVLANAATPGAFHRGLAALSAIVTG